MNSLLFFYASFGLVLLAVIFVYQIAATREKSELVFKISKTWMHGGVGYLIMLVGIAIGDLYSVGIFYVYTLVTLFLALMMLDKQIKIQIIVPRHFKHSVVLFNVLWVIIAVQQGFEFMNVITPVIFIQAIAFFFIGLSFLIQEEYELSVRNLIGVMFIFVSLIKLIYLLDAATKNDFLVSIFLADFMVYLLIGIILIFIDYNRKSISVTGNCRLMMDSIENSTLGVVTLNHRGDIILMNDRVHNSLNLSELSDLEDGVLNVHDMTRLPLDDEWDEIIDSISKGESYSLEADIVLDKTTRSFEFLFLPSTNRSKEEDPYGLNNNVICLILDHKRQYSIVKNVTTEKEEEFNMPNRYQLLELFDIGVNQKLKKRFGIVLIKVVNYDAITNIVNSHEVITIDQMVKKKLEKLDSVYCIGKVTADTFEVITDDVYENDDTIEIIQNIKDVLSHQRFYDSKMNVYSLDYRIGVAMAPDDGFSQRELLRNASIAITKASSHEKGYVQFFNDHIKHELASKLQLETKLRDGIANEQLYLEYQPQFTVSNHEIRGFEALVRWKLEDGTTMSPDEFIPLAESMGLMDELGEWVMEKAIIEASIWHQKYNKTWMLSVNVSITQVEQEGFAKTVLNIIDKYDYPPHLLEVELTETKMSSSSDRVFIELKELQDFGIKIAIDDFGTGYSSLDYLRWIPFNVLKIDKGFIDGLEENGIDYAIVNSVIELVSNLDCETIAEGVETNAQLELLKNTGCDYIQGFIYSRPMTDDAIRDLLDESN